MKIKRISAIKVITITIIRKLQIRLFLHLYLTVLPHVWEIVKSPSKNTLTRVGRNSSIQASKRARQISTYCVIKNLGISDITIQMLFHEKIELKRIREMRLFSGIPRIGKRLDWIIPFNCFIYKKEKLIVLYF